MFVSVVIVAAGSGKRFGGDKMLADLGGVPVIKQTASVFIKSDTANEVIIAASQENFKALTELFAGDKKVFVVLGGQTRSCSVVEGLRYVNRKCDIVAIHDGARPFLSEKLFKKLVGEAAEYGSAIPYVPATDTMYLYNEGARPIALNRGNVISVQTPQVFEYRSIMTAYQSLNEELTDDSRVYLKEYGKLHFTEGETENKKLTYGGDLIRTRIGCGTDVHRFAPDRDFMLGGVKIPYEKGLAGHSDADVLMHAVCDALLSAMGERDIGVQFPDTDMRYKGVAGATLLYKVGMMLESKRSSVVNVTATIICQKPRLSEYIPQMAANIGSVLKIGAERVNLTATTTEGLGMLGEGEGVAVQAFAMIQTAG